MFRNPIYLLWLTLAVGAAAAVQVWAAGRRRDLAQALGRIQITDGRIAVTEALGQTVSVTIR